MSAAILLSGGIDSTALAYMTRPRFALTFDYGQLAAQAERKAARIIASELGCNLIEFDIDLRAFASGRMVGAEQSPVCQDDEWWPFRNQLLVTLSAAIAVLKGINKLYIGTVADDAQYADGRELFITQLKALLAVQEGGVELFAPAIHLSTEDLIAQSKIPLTLLGWCHSCNTSNTPCMQCKACHKHVRVLNALRYFEGSMFDS